MECSIKLDTVKLGWSIVYIEGSQVIISKKCIIFLSLKMNFVLANSADLIVQILRKCSIMWHSSVIHCLPKYPVKGFWSSKG